MDSVAEKSDSSTAAHKPEFRGVIIDDEVKVLSSVENPLSVHGSFVLTKTGDRVLAPAPSGILARGKNTASPPESWFLPDVPVVEGHDGSGCPSGRAESNAAAPPKVEKEVAPRVKHQRWSPRISYDDPTCGTEVGGSGEGEGSVRVSMPERTIQSAAAATGTALAMEPSISESARSPDSKPHSRRFQRSKNRRPVGVPDAANISTEAPAVDIRGVGEMPTAAKNRFSAEHFPLVFDW
ncbi:hypothetical protein DQ04_00801010 [Trypanosoma grayi]|uniref:hypothetical protein n=1 Tax=Trypanosoma grayi TaxID=71804 RepID=UPI0004F4B1A8|nr:hypothetical protein DQ04_00801010 [Trypanosoma grayi]KEG13760.1 hypothetical protein DQ04_00801010 [Trypanosoma grayi]